MLPTSSWALYGFSTHLPTHPYLPTPTYPSTAFFCLILFEVQALSFSFCNSIFPASFMLLKFGHLKSSQHRNNPYRRWLLPSFLLDAFRLTGIDKPVLFRKTTNKLLKQNKKTKVEKRIQISG